jgi:Fuc2NAc and GlcNAc transferase
MWAIGAVTLVLSWLLTPLWTAIAGKKMLDVPNRRSSHVRPTIRGGGLAIVLTSLCSICWAAYRYGLDVRLLAALGGGAAVALIGFMDDRYGMPISVRVLVHVVASIWAVWLLGGIPGLPIGSAVVANAAACLLLVWFTNLFNFMDGIDGLAASQAAFVFLAGATVCAARGLGSVQYCAIILGCSSLGFLGWNWPPARVFMGDVGSCFLGFSFGVLALATGRTYPARWWSWIVLLAVFGTDATLTLLRRILRGAAWYESHRTHAYQHAAQRWGSHSRVTLTIALVNVAWLFPLAWGACIWPKVGPLFALVAVAPLVYVAFRYGAGQDTSTTEVPCSEPGVPCGRRAARQL